MEIIEVRDQKGNLSTKRLHLDPYDQTGIYDVELARVVLKTAQQGNSFFHLLPGCSIVSVDDLTIQVPVDMPHDKCLEIQSCLEAELTRLRALERSIELLKKARERGR